MKNLFKSVAKVWSKASSKALSPQAVQASQLLRESLDSKKDVRLKVLDLLSNLPQKASYPPQIYKLLDRSLDSGQLKTPDMVQMFQTVVKGDSQGALNSKLFIKLHKLPKIDPQVHADNAVMYFEWLLEHKSVAQAIKFIQGIQRQYPLSNENFETLINALKVRHVENIPDLFIHASKPDDATVQTAYLVIAGSNNASMLAKMSKILYEDHHFEFSRKTTIVVLDSHLSLDVDGKRILLAAINTVTEDESLEFLELMIMCVMQFRCDKSIGQPLVKQIMSESKRDMLVKETWDLLLQWEIYSSSNLSVIPDTAREHELEMDSATLSGLLRVADISRRSETEISQLREQFEELGIALDAAGYSILMSRALNAIEVEKARQLFFQSVEQGADWEQDDGRHLPVLSKLLAEVCQSSVDDSVKFDLYQRIRTLTGKPISYTAQLEMLKMFLYRDSTSDLAKYLIEQWGETPNLPWVEHKSIYNAFMDKILACGDYKEAWELYRILNTTISLPYESYIPVQKKFCSLGRPDAAHLMFRHLRNRAKKEHIHPPGREMYLMLFIEYGHWQYEEGVTELDTYFRMDLNNDLDIDIMNAMLLSYSCLSDSPKVKDLWLETNSFAKGKGFNNITGSILLKHLAPMSLEAVDDLWEDMPARYGIKPNEDNLCEYIVANCYHGFYSRALEIVKQAPEIYGINTSPRIISTLYNWTLIESRKQTVKQWASENHAEMWAQLESGDQLRNVLIADDPRDSQDHIRYEAIQKLKEQTAGPLMKAIHRTTDDD